MSSGVSQPIEPIDRLALFCVKLRDAQLRYERALDEYNLASARIKRADEELRDAMTILSRMADHVRDELIVPREVPA